VGVWAAAILSAALLESGDPGRAADLLVASAGGEEAPLVPGAWRATWLEWLTRCWLALGRPAEAERAAANAEARARKFGLRLASASAARATAAVALDAGDAHTAAERALVSAALADEAGAPVAAALSRTLAGRALAQAGETDRAAAVLERAAAELDACGARRYRDRAERELRAVGRAVHRRTRRGRADGGGIASLSGRELEVARLVVDRRTNREIAAELFLSVKTVETHMRNLFRKLDASSRVEVARAMERAERGGHRP
jgi:DNA-binding CsgD family transcriptional regulator